MQKETPYFSIILPIYNVEAYLEDCVESILAQSFEDFELILVDDGAKDNCPQICDHYGERYDCIRVIHKENGGLSSARNAGFEVAAGEYVWWVDADDMIEDGALRCLWEASCDCRPDIVKFPYYRSGESPTKAKSGMSPGIYTRSTGLDELLEQAFLRPGAFCLSACSHIYRRSLLAENELKFVSERIVGSEDYLFNLQTFPKTESFCILQQPLYYYREREGSLTHTFKRDLAEKYTELYRRLLEDGSQNGPEGQFIKNVNTFFVWHLIRGTCMSGEYKLAASKAGSDHRQRVENLLHLEAVQKALSHMNTAGFDWKMQLQRLAMRLKWEPFFYWLYVKKRKKRKTR